MIENQDFDREILFFRYCNGITTPEERELVEKLIVESSLLADELDKVKQAVDVQAKVDEMELCDANHAYSRVHKSLLKRDRGRKLNTVLYLAAAIFVIPLLMTSLIFGYMAFNKNRGDTIYAEIVSAPGVVSQLELPDKSKVWLNSNSRLRYPTEFKDGAREVYLEGEGYFEVRSDKKNPFYVTTESGFKVMAYGTRFNVNTFDNFTETSLAEGNVILLDHDKILKDMLPGEEILYDNLTGKLEVNEVNMPERLAWKDGKIIFRNVPLNKVFDRLGRRYNVEMIIHDEQSVSTNYSSRRVTFTNETIQQIMSYLELAAPIEWKIGPQVQNSDSSLAKQRVDVWFKKE